jgi:hypothetical protein
MTSKVETKSTDKAIDIKINIENNIFSKNKGAIDKLKKKATEKPIVNLNDNYRPEELAEASAGMAEKRLQSIIEPQIRGLNSWRNRMNEYRQSDPVVINNNYSSNFGANNNEDEDQEIDEEDEEVEDGEPIADPPIEPIEEQPEIQEEQPSSLLQQLQQQIQQQQSAVSTLVQEFKIRRRFAFERDRTEASTARKRYAMIYGDDPKNINTSPANKTIYTNYKRWYKRYYLTV